MSTTSDRILRDRQRYTGDGLPNGPTNAPLPVGDPQSGAHTATLPEWREIFDEVEDHVLDAAASALAAAASAATAVDAASDAVSQSNVPIYSTAAAVALLAIPVGLTALRTDGYATVGDGGHAFYVADGAASTGGITDASAPVRHFRLVSIDGTISIKCFGAVGDDATNATVAIQNAIDYTEDRGGGTVVFPKGTYRLTSTASRDVVEFDEDHLLQIQSLLGCLWLPAGVSLRGEKGAKMKRTGGSISVILGLLDWSDAEITGLEIEGAGSSTSQHGILSLATATGSPQLMKNVRMAELYIHDVGSYGLGVQYSHAENATFENLRISRTGADGIDFKGRFGTLTGDPEAAARGVRFENILIEYPAQRLNTNADGMSIAGPCHLNNIHVRGLGRTGADMAGISLRPGLSIGDENRGSATRSSLSNFLVESLDPKFKVTGVSAYSSGPVTIANGHVRWCRRGVWSREETASPRYFVHGANITGVTVEGCRYDPSDDAEQAPFVLDREHTSIFGCRSFSDVQYFDANRSNLTPGQTDFLPVGGLDMTATGGYIVKKNGVTQTLTTHYIAIAGGIRLGAGVLVSDEIIFIARNVRAVRVTAIDCSIVGLDVDRWHLNDLSFESPASEQTTLTVGAFSAIAGVSLSQSEGVAQVRAVSVSADDVDLQLVAKGSGCVRINVDSIDAYASNSAAESGGVPIGGLYRHSDGSVWFRT